MRGRGILPETTGRTSRGWLVDGAGGWIMGRVNDNAASTPCFPAAHSSTGCLVSNEARLSQSTREIARNWNSLDLSETSIEN